MYLTLILLAIFGASMVCLYGEGLWGNTIRLVNVTTAAILAINFFEPLADWIESQGEWFETCTFVWDFLMLWSVFGLSMIVFRVVTDKVSKVRVRFLKIVDQIGTPVSAAITSWVIVCFVAMSLHTAPLGLTFLDGGFNNMEPMLFGTEPDDFMLGFANKMSRHTYCWPNDEQEFVTEDPLGFESRQAARRRALDKSIRETGELRVNP